MSLFVNPFFALNTRLCLELAQISDDFFTYKCWNSQFYAIIFDMKYEIGQWQFLRILFQNKLKLHPEQLSCHDELSKVLQLFIYLKIDIEWHFVQKNHLKPLL